MTMAGSQAHALSGQLQQEGSDQRHLLYVEDGPIPESSPHQRLPTACYCRLAELVRDNFTALCEKPYTLITFAYTNLSIHQAPDFSQFLGHCFHNLTTIHFTRTHLDDQRLGSMHLELLENLRELTLSKNKLVNFPLKLVMTLMHLEELDLSSNINLDLMVFSKDFAELAVEIGYREHRSLKTLNLHGCNIRTVSEEFFWSLPKLADLDLGSNQIKHLPSSCYDQLTDLQCINMEHNTLLDIPQSLTALQQRGCIILKKHNRFELGVGENLTGTDTE